MNPYPSGTAIYLVATLVIVSPIATALPGGNEAVVDKPSGDAVASAQFDFTSTACFAPERFMEQTWSAKYEFAALFAGITVVGIANWDWGSSGFKFNNEGWFNEDRTGSGGMDKVGHAYATYVMSDILMHAIRRNSSDDTGGEVTAALLACSLMTYVEVFDGFSGDHGFSYEDWVADIVGAGFSLFRNSVPTMRAKIDFRMQYLPSEYSSFEPFGDYSGQKFFMVVKLAGFECCRDTPMRFVELHGGYRAKGYSTEEERAGEKHERGLYVGIGINLQELIFGRDEANRQSRATKIARTGLEYIQVPYTYLSTGGNSGR